MKTKKIVALCMALMTLTGFAACTKSGEKTNGSTMTIRVMSCSGGVGIDWVKEAGKRFENKQKDVAYGNKVGVTVKVDGENPVRTSTMASSAYNIYFDEAGTLPSDLAQKGFLLDITDVVTEKDNGVSIEDKIEKTYLSSLKGKDGAYYALPHYEWYPGLVYDMDLFEEENLYFAAPDATATTNYSCTYGSAKFIRNSSAKKSCGIDGIYGNEDDGLPTSIKEMLILCSKMKENAITPFALAGHHNDYSTYTIEGMWASMLGSEGMKAYYALSGEANVITGWTSEALMEGFDATALPKPTVETKTVTPETGYEFRNTAERYYLTAFLTAIKENGWTNKDSANGQSTNIDAQNFFICSGVNSDYEKIGMLMEGSYWYNETLEIDNFEDYEYYTGNTQADRHLGWMSLPTSLETTVTEGNGKKAPLLDTAYSYAFINKNVEKTDGLADACKDFLKFLYSEAELQAFTKKTGVAKAAIDYDYTAADVMQNLATFQKSILQMKKNNSVVYMSVDEPVFQAHRDMMMFGCNASVFRPTVGTKYNSYYEALLARKTAKEVFTAGMMSSWE